MRRRHERGTVLQSLDVTPPPGATGVRSSAAGDAVGYDRVAKTLHWLCAVLVAILICLGLFMTTIRMPIGVKFELYQLHKSIGLALLAIMTARVLWRLTHRPPPLSSAMTTLERMAAHGVHLSLYALLIVMPITGWLMVSAADFAVPTKFFGWLAVPHLEALARLPQGERKPFEDLFKMLHTWIGYSLVALVLLHVAAALRHHLLLKDATLRRMLPGGTRRGTAAMLVVCVGLSGVGAGKAPAQDAPSWTVDTAKSTITFSATAGGEAVTGRFGSFSLAIAFDPDKPEAAKVVVRIQLASVATASKDVDRMLADDAWFGKASEAVYRTAKAERTGDGGFRLLGELTLKGRTLPVTVPFKLTVEGTLARGDSELSLDRTAFGIGPTHPVAGLVIDNDVKMKLVIFAERPK